MNSEKESRKKIETFVQESIRIFLRKINNYLSIFPLRYQKYVHQKLKDRQTLLTGLGCYTGCIYYAIAVKTPNYNEERVLSFVLLYILLDHIIDRGVINHDQCGELSEKLVSEILSPSSGERISDINDITAEILILIYRRLISDNVSIKKAADALFLSEMMGYELQRKIPPGPNIEYLHDAYDLISQLKGGLSVLVIHFIYEEPEDMIESSFYLGAIIQLIDDIFDIEIDKEENIMTYPRYLYISNGTMDFTIEKFGSLIGNINESFLPIIMLSFSYVVDHNKKYFSEDQYKKWSKINILNDE